MGNGAEAPENIISVTKHALCQNGIKSTKDLNIAIYLFLSKSGFLVSF